VLPPIDEIIIVVAKLGGVSALNVGRRAPGLVENTYTAEPLVASLEQAVKLANEKIQ